MYSTCSFCGLTFQNHPNRTDCPYCRSTYLLEATPMEILLEQHAHDKMPDSLFPGLAGCLSSSGEHSAA